MPGTDDAVELGQRRLLSLAVRHWVTLLVMLHIGAFLGATYGAAQTKTYAATAQLAVGPPLTLDDILTGQRPLSSAYGTQIAAEIEVLRSNSVEDAVATVAGVTEQYDVDIQQVDTTNIASITVTSPSAEVAAEVANAYGTTYLERIRQDQESLIVAAQDRLSELLAGVGAGLRRSEADGQSIVDRQALRLRKTELLNQIDRLSLVAATQPYGQARVISVASVPVGPSGLSEGTLIVVGALTGLLAGLAVASLQESIAGRVVNKTDISVTVPAARFLGSVDELRRHRDRIPAASNGATAGKGEHEEAQQYRAVAATIWPARSDSLSLVVYVATVDRDAATATTFVVRLGHVLRDMGRQVAIAHASPEDPGGFRLRHGLDSDSNEGPGSEYLHASTLHGLELSDGTSILVAGESILQSADVLLSAPYCDGLLLLVKKGITRRRQLRQAVERLEDMAGAVPLLGVVILRPERSQWTTPNLFGVALRLGTSMRRRAVGPERHRRDKPSDQKMSSVG